MPCDIGYKSYEKVAIPEPTPEVFAEKTEGPTVDADLLEKLGIEDPEFLEWVKELNTKDLLSEALRRTLSKVNSSGISFTVDTDNTLKARGLFNTPEEKRKLSEVSSNVSKWWQFEILGIVTELLEYETRITQKGKMMTLEAEEAGKSHPCDYIKVTRSEDESEIMFEHFKTRKKLDIAAAKFKVLADKLGVKIIGGKPEISEGDPFPEEVIHTHSHKNRLKN